MRIKFALVLTLMIFLITSFASALTLTESSGTKTVELGTLPSDPLAESTVILAFDVSDSEMDITHIDAYATITNSAGEVLQDRYTLHSHGSQFSMNYKFLEEGTYIVSLEVEPSEHYNGPKFDTFTVNFSLEVIPSKDNGAFMLYTLGVLITFIFLGSGYFVLKLSKKKVSKE